jgi:hypothetical protein
MPSVIEGKNVLLEMYITASSEYVPILCATDCTFRYTPEFITKTGPNSPAREFALRIYEWAFDVTGLTKIANESPSSLSFFYMLQSSIRRTSHDFRMTFEDDEGNDYEISGVGFVGESTINGPQTDFSNASIQIKGTGGVTIDFVADPTPGDFDVLSDWWQSSNGNSYINGASSGETDGINYTLQSTDEILRVWNEGGGYEIVSGAPGNRECQLDLSNHKIKFADAFDGNQRVAVLFKRPV